MSADLVDASETEAVNFAVRTILRTARKMPVSDACVLLRGFLACAEGDAFPEVRALYQQLRHCDAQLELIAQP